MSCQDKEPALSRYLDGEISAAGASELERHFESCERCRGDLASLGRLSDLLGVRTEPDPYFLARFRARRDRELSIDAGWLAWRRLAVRMLPVAGGALAGAAVVVWLSLEKMDLSELEARELGNGFQIGSAEEPYPVLQIALQPFPEAER